ncbi:MAG: DUF805 domain-containing protein [Chthoniobacterales bacterium]
MNYYIDALKKWNDFQGRSRRTEFWMFALFNFIVSLVIGFVETLVGSPGILATIYSLVVLIPGLAISVRRLHDTDRSGWWLLVSLVPLIGIIVLLIFFVIDSTPGANRFGASSKS